MAEENQAEESLHEMLYHPINPEQDYDRENFIQHYEDFSDMSKWLQILQKDPENTDAWEDSGELLRENSLFYFNAKRTPRSDLEDTLSQEYDNLGKYAEKHSSTFYGKLEPEDYAELIQSVPLYKTGNKKHDEFVEIIGENRKLAEASRDRGKMAKYVQEKISKSPEWAQISFMRYGENDLDAIFQSYFKYANTKLEANMLDKNGKVKSGFLKKVFKDSLDEAEKELEREDYSDSEKNDVWKRNIRPYYMALLEKVYEKEKKDEDIPQEKKDRNKRRKERREKGMPF